MAKTMIFESKERIEGMDFSLRNSGTLAELSSK